MLVLFELRIVVGRQHFSVGVDIHPRALRLLQKHFQIPQVVAGNKDAGIWPDPKLHLGNLGIPKGRGIGLVQQGHGLHPLLPRL